MEIAARIQTALLPHALAVEGYDLALEMLAATEVGGDLVEFHPRPDGTFWLAVGDVTGHGLTPGLVMMMAQSMLTGFIMEQPAASPRALLGRLNRALHQNVRYRLGADHYMTLQLVRHQGFGRFVAAGLHCDMLIHRAASGRVERVRTEGCWIGLVPEVEDLLAEVAFELAPGDTLVMYTDGLIEAADARHEQYDVRRLERLVADGAGLGAAALKARILADVRAWMSAQGDDISVVVLQRAAHVSPARSAGLVREVIDV
jgi:sigma-B regulation protein RsbU (phosphoserine phosphatase)